MKNFILFGLLCLICSFSHASEGARKDVYVSPVYTHEGNGAGRILFAVDCASHVWTTVQSSETYSRSILFIALSDNAGGVCLSTTTTAGTTCADATLGPELSPGSSMTDYSTGNWNCRSRANNVDTIKGYRSKHSEDSTSP